MSILNQKIKMPYTETDLITLAKELKLLRANVVKTIDDSNAPPDTFLPLLEAHWKELCDLNFLIANVLYANPRGNRVFFEKELAEIVAMFEGLPVSFGVLDTLTYLIELRRGAGEMFNRMMDS